MTFVFRWETEEERGEKKKGGGEAKGSRVGRKARVCVILKGGKVERERERKRELAFVLSRKKGGDEMEVP